MSRKFLIDLKHTSLDDATKNNGLLIHANKTWRHINLWFEVLPDDKAFVYTPEDIPNDLREELDCWKRDVNGNKITDTMSDNTNKTYTDEEIKTMNVVYDEVKPMTWFEQGVSEVAKSFETLYSMQQIADERKKYHVGTPDRIVQDVIKKFDVRSMVGIQKYKTTLDDNNYDNFLEHAQEEMLDGALYLQKLIDQRKNDWAYTRDFWLTLKDVINGLDNVVGGLEYSEQLCKDVIKLIGECNKRLKPQIENL